MNRLAGSRAYLCGAMDRAADGGEGWRRMSRIELRDLKIQWLDPTRKPIDIGVEDDASKMRRHRNKKAGRYNQVTHEMIGIRNVDLRMVHICDWVLVNLDLEVHACGTYREIFKAVEEEKPTLIRIEQGKENTPDWLFSEIPDEYFFSTWDETFDYVRGVANGDIEDMYDKWFFFHWMGSTK